MTEVVGAGEENDQILSCFCLKSFFLQESEMELAGKKIEAE
ncbi:hypothetical protein [Gimesia maris]